MKKILAVISKIALFNGIPSAQLEAIIRIAVNRQYHPRETVFCDGDEADGFYVIISGKIKVFKLSPDGKEKILHIFETGQPFGEVPVFSEGNFPANAQAITKSHLVFFPRSAFIRLISDQPSLALKMLAVLSVRLREFALQIENLALKEVPGRLASYLTYLAKEQDRSDTVSLTISKNQLASLLGTIPETLSRIFSKMSSQGLIEVNGRKIHLLDLGGLTDLSESGKTSF